MHRTRRAGQLQQWCSHTLHLLGCLNGLRVPSRLAQDTAGMPWQLMAGASEQWGHKRKASSMERGAR